MMFEKQTPSSTSETASLHQVIRRLEKEKYCMNQWRQPSLPNQICRVFLQTQVDALTKTTRI